MLNGGSNVLLVVLPPVISFLLLFFNKNFDLQFCKCCFCSWFFFWLHTEFNIFSNSLKPQQEGKNINISRQFKIYSQISPRTFSPTVLLVKARQRKKQKLANIRDSWLNICFFPTESAEKGFAKRRKKRQICK